jgi:hypothetical protein
MNYCTWCCTSDPHEASSDRDAESRCREFQRIEDGLDVEEFILCVIVTVILRVL